jgi:hypothetical protein
VFGGLIRVTDCSCSSEDQKPQVHLDLCCSPWPDDFCTVTFTSRQYPLSLSFLVTAYRYQIAFQMMKTKYSTHEIITGNKHSVSFNKEKCRKKNDFSRLQNKSKKSVHCNPSK